MKKSIADQIRDLENTRAAKAARLEEVTQKSIDDERSMDEAEAEEFDTLEGEIKSIDADLARLVRLQSVMASKAAPAAGTSLAVASASRDPATAHISMKSNLPKGTGFTRYALALARSKGNLVQAVEIAKRAYKDSPEVITVLKAASDAGTTTDADWALPLVEYQTLANEFIELLRPQTIIGRIPNLRNVPFNVRMPRQTGGGTYGWVGEGAPKPVGQLSFDEVTLRWAKAAGIIVLTEELIRQSSPAAEGIVRGDMIAGIAQFLDGQFVDPAVAAVSNVSPASITNGVTPVSATGTDAAALRADVATLWEDTFLSQNLVPTTGFWVMDNVTAMRLSLMRNPLGQAEFVGITPTGGTFMGYPVITSQGVPSDSGGGLMIFGNAQDILFAEDTLTLDVSREASLQMDTAPTDPTVAATVMVSLWQRNLVGLRAERFINWQKRRANAVGYIDNAQYGINGT